MAPPSRRYAQASARCRSARQNKTICRARGTLRYASPWASLAFPGRRLGRRHTTVRAGALDLGREILDGVRVGIAHHLGWAVAVTASAGHEVVDRRRIELIEPGMPTAPIEHEAKALDGDASARMVAEVRASVLRATSASDRKSTRLNSSHLG